MVSTAEMKDRLARLYEAANEGNLAVFDELLAPDFVNYSGAGLADVHGIDGFKQFYKDFLGPLPDLTFRVDDVIAEGDKVATRGTLSGTHEGNFMGIAEPTHKRITWSGIALMRFRDDGLMDARWLDFDGISFMQQLGVIPGTPAALEFDPPEPPPVTDPMKTTPEENKAVVRRFIEEVWNQRNVDVADEIFHPEATCPSAPQLPKGAEGVRAVATLFHNAFPDFQMTFEDLLAEGDRVYARWTESGTHEGELMGVPPTGKAVRFSEMGILRFGDGKIVESWFEADILGLMGQLGVGGPALAG